MCSTSHRARWRWASPPTSSRRNRCPRFTQRRWKCCATGSGGPSLSASRRRSATRMVGLITGAAASTDPSWNPCDDLALLFHYDFMVHAFEAGTVVAIVAGAIGYFVVLRGSAFAPHALSAIGLAGATRALG